MANKSIYYFYVLACADGTLYTGYTTDLERREKEHQRGQGAKYTRPQFRRPCQMLFSKAFLSRSLAMSCEYHFKQLTRRQKENELRQIGVTVFHVSDKQKRVDLGPSASFFESWQKVRE